MKRLASAITFLIASTLATAADTQVRVDESLVLAYVTTAADFRTSPEEHVSLAESEDRALATLDQVSASLGYELEMRISEVMTAKAE